MNTTEIRRRDHTRLFDHCEAAFGGGASRKDLDSAGGKPAGLGYEV